MLRTEEIDVALVCKLTATAEREAEEGAPEPSQKQTIWSPSQLDLPPAAMMVSATYFDRTVSTILSAQVNIVRLGQRVLPNYKLLQFSRYTDCSVS